MAGLSPSTPGPCHFTLMKTAEQYEAKIAELEKMIAWLKLQLDKALEAYVEERTKNNGR